VKNGVYLKIDKEVDIPFVKLFTKNKIIQLLLSFNIL